MLPRKTALAGAGATASGDAISIPSAARPKLDVGFGPRTAIAFFSVLGLVLFFVGYSIYHARQRHPHDHDAPAHPDARLGE